MTGPGRRHRASPGLTWIEPMLFFSNRLGCVPSLLLSIGASVILYLIFTRSGW